MSEMAGGELLVVATIRDELAPGLEAIRTELSRVAVAQERVAATSTQASAGLTREGVAAERTTAQLRAVDLANKNASRSFGVLGVQVPKTAAAIAITLAASVYAAGKFESAITRVQTQAGASASEVARMRGELLKLSPQVGIGPDQLAESLYHVESAGFRGAVALQAVTAAAHGAAIGNANLEDVTQAMIASLASGIKGVHGADDAMALLNRTVGIGDMRMQQLTRALATGILPSARSAGLRFNDVAAALATITDNATPADEAATRLRMTFALLSSPSHAAEKALATIGMTSTQMADDMRKPRGLLIALTDLRAHLAASGKSATEQNQVLERAFGGGRTSGAILTLLGQMDRLQSKYDELGTAGERMAEYQAAWAAYTDTLSYKWHSAVAGFETGAVIIGSKLLPSVKMLLDGIIGLEHGVGDVVGFFRDHQAAAAALAAVLVMSLVPSLISTATWIARVIALNAGAMFFVLRAAVAGAAEAFVAAGGGIRGMAAALATLNINPVVLGLTAVAAIATFAWMKQRQAIDAVKQSTQDWVSHLGASTSSLSDTSNAVGAIGDRIGKLNAQLMKLPDPNDSDHPLHFLVDWGPFKNEQSEKFREVSAQIDTLTAAREKLLAQAATIRTNEEQLSQTYGLTGGEVEQLANRYGIDLSGALDVVGPKFDKVIASVRMSHHANRQAALDIDAMSSSATSAADAVTLLKDSLDALLGNEIAADQAAIAYRDRIVQLDKALRHSGGSMSMNSARGRDARQAFDEAAGAAMQWVTAVQQSTDDTGKTSAALKRAIGFLAPFAKGNNYAAQQVKALRSELRQLQGGIDALHGKTISVDVVQRIAKTNPQLAKNVRQGNGDTPGPRAGRFGDVMDLHRRLSGIPGKRSITSHVRGWGLGSANSDHATGRAIDLVGSGLGAYALAARRAGGFAEFHGDGDGRHLHVAAGDTPGPRGPMVGPRGGDDGGMHLHVTLEAGSVVVGGNPDPGAVEDAVARGAARGGRRALDRARVGSHRFGAR